MKKDFSNSLAETMNVLSGGKLSDPAELEPIPMPEPEFIKIVLRMKKDLHSALQQIALDQAAKKGKRYSLTELINDVLTE